MIYLSKPLDYRGFLISFDLVKGVSFADRSGRWTARSYREARQRIDVILAERESRAKSLASGQSSLVLE